MRFRSALLMCVIVGAVFAVSNAAAQTRVTPSSRAELQLSFAPLVKKSAPTVVNVYTRKVVQARQMAPLLDDPFFRRFFERRLNRQNSLGSGVIVRPNGTIVTNYHVIEGADEITIVLHDRREFEATIMGSDPHTDLAVLKIDAKGEALPFLEFRDSDDLEVGDLVLAIGNPFGVGQTVTSGIVSALARTQVGISDLNFFIQTDAAINPGNSGGALVTLDGKLVGINSAIYSQSGGSIGIGFAIPSNMVASVVNAVVGGGKLVRPWLGVAGQPVTNELAGTLGMKLPTGVLVNEVYPGGPAERAGIRVGDVIRAVNGREVSDLDALKYRIATHRMGERAAMELVRRGQPLAVDFPVEAPPEVPPRATTELGGNHPLQGATVANLSPALADELSLDFKARGPVVTEVRRGTAAQRFGFQKGDILMEINGAKMGSVAELQRVVAKPASRWRISIQRGGQTLALQVAR